MRESCSPVLRLIIVVLVLAAWGGPAFCHSIHDAARACNATQVGALLEGNPGLVSSKDDFNRTPLHIAARKGCGDVVELLLARGADANARDKSGATPFQNAAWRGNRAQVELFLAHGADVQARDNHGCGPLYLASVQGRKDVAELLLDKGVDVNARDNTGTTSLHIAAQQGYTGVAEALLTRGADVGARDSLSQTPLHYAAKGGRKEAAALLLDKGAEIDARDDIENTPLHYASWNGHKGVVELLLARGADVHAGNRHGLTPLCYATWQNHKDVEELLRSRNAGLSFRELIFSRSTHWDAHPFDLELMIFVILSLVPSAVLFSLGKRREGISSATVMSVLAALLFTARLGSITYLILLAGSGLWIIQIPYIAILLIGAESPLGNRRMAMTVQEAAPGIPPAPITPGGSSLPAPREPIAKSTMLFIAAVIIFAGIIACAMADDVSQRKMALWCMFAGVAAVFVVDVFLEKKRRNAREVAETKRADELIGAITGSDAGSARSGVQGQDGEAVIFGSTGIVIGSAGVLIGLLTGYLLYTSKGSPPVVGYILAAFFLLLGVLAILKALPFLGRRPLLRLSGQGFYSPAYGFMPWGEVQGICMRELKYQGLVTGYFLDFNVPRLSEYVKQFHPVTGFLYKVSLRSKAMKKVIFILLRKTSEPPATTYLVARRLWKEATGRDAIWYPGMSPEVGAAWERLDEQSSKALEEMRRAYRHSAKQYGKLAKAYTDSLGDHPETRDYLEIIKKDAARRAMAPRIAIAVVLSCILALKLMPLLKKLFG